jgi:tetratricopeptide (TPR) repeat protein
MLKNDDPLLPKMWLLRGVCCVDAGELLAAKQAYHKSYDEYKSIEAAINLAQLYMTENNYDKAISILEEIYKLEDFKIPNTSIDPIQIESSMLKNLGDSYLHKADMEKQDLEKRLQFIQKAEEHYREYLSIRPNLQVINMLCRILRQTNRRDEAAMMTIKAINKFPGYFVGWSDIASYEYECGRLHTARIFFKEAIRLKPNFKEAKSNLINIERYLNARKS